MGVTRRATWVVVAVLWVVLAVEKCRAWEETVEDMKGKINQMSDDANIPEKAEAVKEGAAGVLHDAKDKAESWSSWVYNKISGGGKAEEAAATEAAPKETAHFVVERAGEVTSGGAATMVEGTATMVEGTAKAAVDAAGRAKEKVEKAAGSAKEKASKMMPGNAAAGGDGGSNVKSTEL